MGEALSSLDLLLKRARLQSRWSAASQVVAIPLCVLATALGLWECSARFMHLQEITQPVLLLAAVVLGWGVVRALRTPDTASVLRMAGRLAGDPMLFASLERSEQSALGELITAQAGARARDAGTDRPLPPLALRLLPLALILAVLACLLPHRVVRQDGAAQSALAAATARARELLQEPDAPADAGAIAARAVERIPALDDELRRLARVAAAAEAPTLTSAEALALLAQKAEAGLSAEQWRQLNAAVIQALDAGSSVTLQSALKALLDSCTATNAAGAASALRALAQRADLAQRQRTALAEVRFLIAASAGGAAGATLNDPAARAAAPHSAAPGLSIGQRQHSPEDQRLLERYFR